MLKAFDVLKNLMMTPLIQLLYTVNTLPALQIWLRVMSLYFGVRSNW